MLKNKLARGLVVCTMAVIVLAVCIVCLILGRTRGAGGDDSDSSSVESGPRSPTVAVAASAHSSGQAAVSETPTAWVPLCGRVMDSGHRAVAGARVVWWLSHEDQLVVDLLSKTDARNGETCADGNGDYQLAVPVGKTVIVQASAEGYGHNARTVEIPEAGLDGFDLVLVLRSSIAGRVLDAGGRPVADVAVVAACGGRLGVSEPSAKDGRYALGNLGAGDYEVRARYVPRDPGKRWPGWLRLEPGGPSLLTLTLDPEEHRTGVDVMLPLGLDRRITGSVADETGAALGGAEVWAIQPEHSRQPLGLSPRRTGGDGRFSLEGLGTEHSDFDVVQVDCVCEGYEPARMEDVPVGTGNLVLRMRRANRGGITGAVLNAGSREPVTDARVHVWMVDTDWGETWRAAAEKGSGLRDKTIRTDRQGRFAIDNVPPGRASLAVYSPEYGFTSLPVRVRGGQTTDVQVLLPAPGILRVSVAYSGSMTGKEALCDVRCAPVGDQGCVTVYPDLADEFLGKEPKPIRAVGAGHYEFALAPGDYDVSVTTRFHEEGAASIPAGRNYQTARVQVKSGIGQTVEFTVGGTGAVFATVPAGDRDRRTFVMAVPGSSAPDLSGAANPYTQFRQIAERYGAGGVTYTNADGEAVLNCLEPGTYTLTAFAQSRDGAFRVRGSHTVIVQEGESKEVRFE